MANGIFAFKGRIAALCTKLKSISVFYIQKYIIIFLKQEQKYLVG